jgi:beta-galactosidase
MLHDYDSLWALQWQPHHCEFDYRKHFTHYSYPLAALNVSADVLSAKGLLDIQTLANYKLVIAPALLIQDRALVEALQNYVAEGGHLLLTLRCGMKDRYNALLPQRQPGGLAEMAGVEVEEYYALLDPVPVSGSSFIGQSSLWAERLAPIGKNVRALARYGKSNGWLDDQLAISSNEHGKGRVYYVGAYLDDAAQQTFMEHVLEAAKVTTYITAPGIEIRTRVQPGGEDVHIVINHSSTMSAVHIPWPSFDHLKRTPLGTDFELSGYSVAILTRDEKRV